MRCYSWCCSVLYAICCSVLYTICLLQFRQRYSCVAELMDLFYSFLHSHVKTNAEVLRFWAKVHQNGICCAKYATLYFSCHVTLIKSLQIFLSRSLLFNQYDRGINCFCTYQFLLCAALCRASCFFSFCSMT